MHEVLRLNDYVFIPGMHASQRLAASAMIKALSTLLPGSPAGSPSFVQMYRHTVNTCCRPRKGLPEAHDMEDIQRFFIVMMPLSRAAPARLIVVGKKRLPEEGQCFWAAVLAAAPAVSTSCL